MRPYWYYYFLLRQDEILEMAGDTLFW